MRNFAIAALAAVPAFGQWQWIDFRINNNGSSQLKHFYDGANSSGSVTGGTQLTVGSNSAMFLKDSMDMDVDKVFKPNLRGGSISYDVNLSTVDCGCVAGVYLVKTSETCGQDPMDTDTPMCPSIDVMQANKWGFNVAAHPCANGTCDAASQCDLDMKIDGIAKYGSSAYGPRGTLIDTRSDFQVKTEFVSDAARATLWKLRTTLQQSGRTIMMEADCGDSYFNAMTDSVQGDMGLVFSNWDNTKGDAADFESCNAPVANCDSARTVIDNFAISSWYSNEDRYVAPEPTPDVTPDVTPDEDTTPDVTPDVTPDEDTTPTPEPDAELIRGGLADTINRCAEGCTSC